MWFYTLMPFARMGLPYFSLKVISYVIILAVIIIIALKAPFDKYIKALFVLSPMCIYSFVTPSRCYCLCALFTVLAALKYKDRGKQPLLYGLILALNMQTHIIMAGFVVAECVEWFISVIMESRRERKFNRSSVMQFAGMAIVFLSGLFLLYEFRDTGRVASVSVMSVSRLPQLLTRRFIIVCGLAVLITLIFVLGLSNSMKITAPFIVFAASILWQVWIHYFVTSIGNFREITWAYLLMWFIWVIHDLNCGIKPIKKAVLSYVFIIGLYMWYRGYGLMWRDIFYKYSGAENAAYVIEAMHDDATLVETAEDFCNAVIPYLKKKVVYNPFQKTEASYIDRNPSLRHKMSCEELIHVCREMFPNKRSMYLLVCNGGWSINNLADILSDENLYYSDAQSRVLAEHFSIYKLMIQ